MNFAPDPAFAALLADPRLALRPPPPGVTLDQYRRAANGFMAGAPVSSDCSSVDLSLKSPSGLLNVRLVRPAVVGLLPAILFVHGGGFVLGSLESHQAMACSLAIAATAVTVSVDYRLAPEHPCPAALDDVAAVLDWLFIHGAAHGIDPSRLAIAGDSAGGMIAALISRKSASGGTLRHLGLFYPLLDPLRSSTSATTYAEGFMLTGEFLDWAWSAFAGDAGIASIPSLDEALPPTTIVTAQFDPLRDEGAALAARLSAAGVDVDYHCAAGMIHGFAGLPHVVPAEADAAINRVGRRIGASLRA